MYPRGIVYGVDILTPFEEWMANVFTPAFKLFHPDAEFAGYIMEPGAPGYAPGVTARSSVLTFSTTKDESVTNGLLNNVDGKAKYSLRTGLDSSTAPANLHLVLPGDFPYDGFLTHRGIRAGGSGVRKELDEVYVRDIVDKYIELRETVFAEVRAVLEWARKNFDDIGRWKYFDGDIEMLNIYRQAHAEAFAD